MDLLSRVTSDPGLCHGKPCIRGLRYPVEWLLDLLAAGDAPADILADHPDLEADDIRAAMAFAAKVVRTKRLIPFAA